MSKPSYLPLRTTSAPASPPLSSSPSPSTSKSWSHLTSGRLTISRPLQLLGGAASLLLVLSFLGLRQPDSLQALRLWSSDHPVCDPFSRPGSVIFQEDKNPKWKPFARDCGEAVDWLDVLRGRSQRARRRAERLAKQTAADASVEEKRQAEEEEHDPEDDWDEALDGFEEGFDPIAHLRGKYILVLGDSVDRNGLEQIAALTESPFYTSTYDSSLAGTKMEMEGWDIRGTPHIVDFPGTDGFKIVNGFYYGQDDTDEFRAQGDWHAPGRFEERVDELFYPMTSRLGRPSLITLHSGLWDLALFGRQDRHNDGNLTEGLSEERMDWWQERMRSVIRKTRSTWPGVPVWVRGSHRIGDSAWASHDWSPGINMDVPFTNFFTDIRAHQIRQMQRHIAAEEGVPFFDFGLLWEGFQSRFQDKVHPLVFPGGALYGNPLLHHFYMESLGRKYWEPTLQKNLAKGQVSV